MNLHAFRIGKGLSGTAYKRDPFTKAFRLFVKISGVYVKAHMGVPDP